MKFKTFKNVRFAKMTDREVLMFGWQDDHWPAKLALVDLYLVQDENYYEVQKGNGSLLQINIYFMSGRLSYVPRIPLLF